MIRANEASMPGYDPPKVTHLLAALIPKAEVACRWKVARSASACREESQRSGFSSDGEYGQADILWQP